MRNCRPIVYHHSDSQRAVAQFRLPPSPLSDLIGWTTVVVAMHGRVPGREAAELPGAKGSSAGYYSVINPSAPAAGCPGCGSTIPIIAELRHAQGGPPADQDAWLRVHPAALVHMARQLLEAHFPETLHDDLCDRFGLSLQEPASGAAAAKRPRDPRFRDLILRAYEFRCAVCGFDGRLDTTVVGLEAAHVRWHQAAGPDTEDNGLALCSIHHKLFDLGVFSLTPVLSIAVSDLLNRSAETNDLMLRHHAQALRGPRPDKAPVAETFRDWHWQQVFKKPARAA